MTRKPPTDTSWIVQLWSLDGHMPIGSGVLLPGKTLVSCAHVVTSATGFDDPFAHGPARIKATFPQSTQHDREYRATVLPEGWFPIEAGNRGDIAILTLDDVPDDVRPARIGHWDAPTTRPLHIYGKSAEVAEPLWATCHAVGHAGPAGEWVQLDADGRGGEIAKGYSGGGVVDMETGTVLGILTAVLRPAARTGGPRVSWMIPFQTIERYWPDIARYFDRQHAERESSRIWELPIRSRHFVGRAELLQRMRTALGADGRPSIVVLDGPGGVGKSQLITEYAYQHSDDYDLVWWLPADDSASASARLAALGERIGVVGGAGPAGPAQRVLQELARRDRWLLVLDNAEDRDAVYDLVPRGRGHVVITTRDPGWKDVGNAMPVGRLTPDESVTLLRHWLPDLDLRLANRLSLALDFLPLALAQAAATLSQTGMTVDVYLGILKVQSSEILKEGRPSGYPVSLAASWTVAMERLAAQQPEAVRLLEVASLCAPEPIPLSVLGGSATIGRPIADDELTFYRAVQSVRRFGLAQVESHQMQLHRLGRLIIQHRMPAATVAQRRRTATDLLAASRPGLPRNPENWARYSALISHVRDLDLVTSENADARALFLDTAEFMARRGDVRSSVTLLEHAHAHLLERFGPDHPEVLWSLHLWANGLHLTGDYQVAAQMREETLRRYAGSVGLDHPDSMMCATNLATESFNIGDYSRARQLNEETLNRRRRILGADHQETLRSASNLVTDLIHAGQYQQALDLNEDTLRRRRSLLGIDHPDVLTSSSKMAICLFLTGRYEEARALDEDTLARRTVVLGANHQDTFSSASNLANDLFYLGQHNKTAEINSRVYRERRQILGPDHPDTLTSASNVASDLIQAGRIEEGMSTRLAALTARRRLLGEKHPDTLAAANDRAVDLLHIGDSEGGRRLLLETSTVQRAVLGEGHPDSLIAAANNAIILHMQGADQEALEAITHVAEVREQKLGSSHPETQHALRIADVMRRSPDRLLTELERRRGGGYNPCP